MEPRSTMKAGAVFIAATIAASVSGAAFAAGGAKVPADIGGSWEGPFGKFDTAQLQRGYQIYDEVCASCHSLKYLSYRNLGEAHGPNFSEDEVKAIAAGKTVEDGPNEDGDMFERDGLPADRFVSPFPNEQAARASNGGALPPDLTLITKNRVGWHGTVNQFFNGTGGPAYLHALLTGYEDDNRPACFGDADGYYNPYFAAGFVPEECMDEDGHSTVYGSLISMAPPLSDDFVEYADGTPATVDQMARDLTAFLTWAGEPTMVERKQMGLKIIVFLIIFAVLLWFSYQKVWRDVHH